MVTVKNGGLETAFKKGLCLQLRMGTLGIRRKVSSEDVQHDADPNLIHVSKEILECDEYSSIQRLNGEVKKYLSLSAVPAMLQRSLYLIPEVSIKRVLEKLEELSKEREKLVKNFIGVYEKAQKDAKKKLGSLYDENDYPPVEYVRETFYLNVQIMQMEVPGKLKSISVQLYEQEKAKLEEKFREAAEEIRLLLRETLHDLVKHLSERLSGAKKDGKPKIFRGTAVTNLTEFIDSFDPRNMTTDHELEELVKKTKKAIQGIDPEELRTDEKLREKIGMQMSTIGSALDKLVMDKPGRKLRLPGKED